MSRRTYAPADIYLVFLTKAHLWAKTRALVDFLCERFSTPAW